MDIPQHDLVAEQIVLGTMIIDSKTFYSGIEQLDENDFYDTKNKIIFGAIKGLNNEVKNVDIIILKEELEKIGKLQNIGGIMYLSDLTELSITSKKVQKYIDILKDKTFFRQLKEASLEILKMSGVTDKNKDEILNEAGKKIFGLYSNKKKEVTSVEGLAEGGEYHPIQKAFMEYGAFQCGFCTPGMLMSAVTLLAKNKKPTRQEARAYMAGNLCRCGSYEEVLDAIMAVADTV